MSVQENSAPLMVPAGQPRAHETLLERYLNLLRDDPHILAATAQPSREHTLQWAADELRLTASTLRGATREDAEYELERVLHEVRERLGLAWGR
ncbi:hypothetical protein [Archangium lipolyticum]|uniref:hypothetical protein n=1 Tax=Archangium lipolyticum TaxID=2970465 RepID=UPI002149D48F|nr:hypothetical protein [Archangium lipolyticum]